MPNSSILWAVPVLAVLLSGCGIAAKVNARQDMAASKVAYKACLAQYHKDTAACDGLRRSYEADLSAYQATSAALRSAPMDAPSVPGPPPAAALAPLPPLTPIPPNPMSVIIGPNGQAHPCMAMGPMMTVCN
jgi:hypothetical protein